MSRPGRNARKRRAELKREPMPVVGMAWTRWQAKDEGLAVLGPKVSAHRRLGPRLTEDRKKRPWPRPKAA